MNLSLEPPYKITIDQIDMSVKETFSNYITVTI